MSWHERMTLNIEKSLEVIFSHTFALFNRRIHRLLRRQFSLVNRDGDKIVHFYDGIAIDEYSLGLL